MKTSLELINMSKATSGQHQSNIRTAPGRWHVYIEHTCKMKWKVLSFPSCSLFIPICKQTLHCLLLAHVFPRSIKITNSNSTYSLSHSCGRDISANQATVDHSWVLSRKVFITRQTKISRKQSQWGKGNFMKLFKIFWSFCFRELSNLCSGRNRILGRGVFSLRLVFQLFLI